MAGKFVGDISPEEAWAGLAADPDAILLDVRTVAEWAYVGGPDLSDLGRDVLRIEWQTFPDMGFNANFLKELADEGVMTDQPVYVLCRSGARSRQAAELLARHGFQTYNIRDGFEGHLDTDNHRGVEGGWKAAGLPWAQG
jgi:rhodanese-related sulfurtransferase